MQEQEPRVGSGSRTVDTHVLHLSDKVVCQARGNEEWGQRPRDLEDDQFKRQDVSHELDANECVTHWDRPLAKSK